MNEKEKVSRDLVVVDCETTGLHDDAAILEVAAVNVRTGEVLQFVPYVSQAQLALAQPEALQINRYYERGLWRNMRRAGASTALQFCLLRDMLSGNTFAGSNPRFDAKMVAAAEAYRYDWDARRQFGMPPPKTVYTGTPWHHRLADLAAYAAGKLHFDPTELPGLATVCELLDVENTAPHTALGDALATTECFRKLAAMRRRL